MLMAFGGVLLRQPITSAKPGESAILYTEDLPHTEEENRNPSRMPTLDEAFAGYLKKTRGTKTYAAFSHEVGIAESTLHRLIHGDQSGTLAKVEEIMKRLNVSPRDIFGDEVNRRRCRRG